MPRYDGTGPLWGGDPGTGWGLGPCGLGMRRGMGMGYGRGYGFRRWTKQDEKIALEEEIKILREELKAAEEELKSLRGQK